MSELRVDSVKSKGGGAPDLPKGVTISGITTAVTLGATQIDVSNVNVSGVVTSGTLSGDLLSTGTPTLGLGVTINSSGLVISGVATAGIVSATTLYGNGENLTGIAATLAPIFYNPDTSDSSVSFGTGIGITFNQQIKAGTGNITIREGSSSGTVIENFGVGSSVTISENRVSFTPTSNLSEGVVYHLNYPSGCFTNNEGTDYVGTAYTFKALGYDYTLWGWGNNNLGQLGQNNETKYSSPVQIPGVTWKTIGGNTKNYFENAAIKVDGTLWAWGSGSNGRLAQNNTVSYSSPVQVGSESTWALLTQALQCVFATKTDGTAWVWGSNTKGQLGQNTTTPGFSSPVQIPGTTWPTTNRNHLAGGGDISTFKVIKTDGTLWSWGEQRNGLAGINEGGVDYSSPVQMPGTWSSIAVGNYAASGVKTDGTLWSWGYNWFGQVGDSSRTQRSSPVQLDGTTWSTTFRGFSHAAAVRTDGTLWTWGRNEMGQLGQNNETQYSSPKQVPGTTWSTGAANDYTSAAIKTDGTLWTWGHSGSGELGQGVNIKRSSPTQVGSRTDWHNVLASSGGFLANTKS